MWPIGALTAGVFKLLLDVYHVSPDMEWRLVLAGGAIPAFAVLYLRQTMPESARFLARMAAEQAAAHDVMKQVAGEAAPPPPPRDDRPFWTVLSAHMPHILAAAWLWMVYDLVVYSTILFGPNLIAKGLGLTSANFTILNELLFVLPASILFSLFLIDRVGRKPLQVWGFLLSAVVLLGYIKLKGDPSVAPMILFIIFGIFNVTMTGPGLVSGAGVFGVELAPTRVRSVAQAITVCGGRIGAAISGFVFPVLFGAIGEIWTMGVLAALSLVGGISTQLMVPETSARSLEDITGEFSATAVES
jgi:MFS family permease